MKRAGTHFLRPHPTSDAVLLEQGTPNDSAVLGGEGSGAEHPVDPAPAMRVTRAEDPDAVANSASRASVQEQSNRASVGSSAG